MFRADTSQRMNPHAPLAGDIGDGFGYLGYIRNEKWNTA
jgi:hypothetical protein